MKIICNKIKLQEAVLNVQRAVSPKSTIPALEGILIETENNQVKLSGYNLELGITTMIEAEIEQEGKSVLNARLLAEIVRKMPAENIEIDSNKQNIATIKSGASEFAIVEISSIEYPELPTLQQSTQIDIPSLIMKSMIKQTLFAVADNDTKPIHTGILFDINDKLIQLVAVDGYRLALRRENIQSEENTSFVVPGKTLNEVVKLLPDNEDKITIFQGSRHVIFRVKEYTIISRLLEGEFLDYKSAIPDAYATKARVNTRDFIESVERMSLLINDRIKSPLRCIMSNNEIKFSCSTSIGKANDEIQANIDGNSLEIGFNNKYLLDALKNSLCDEIQIQLNGPLSPMKVLPLEGNSFLFLVLPVRLKT